MEHSIPRDLLKFLEAADNLYIRAYQTKRYGILNGTFTREAIEAVTLNIINSNGMRYFAEKTYRKNTWEILSEDEKSIRVRKTQIYKLIHISLLKTMKASSDYIEEWLINKCDKSKYIVAAIGREEYI